MGLTEHAQSVVVREHIVSIGSVGLCKVAVFLSLFKPVESSSAAIVSSTATSSAIDTSTTSSAGHSADSFLPMSSAPVTLGGILNAIRMERASSP